MSLAIVENFAAASGDLHVAMRSADVAVIENAITAFRTSLEAVQSVENWEATPDLKLRCSEIISQLDSSRMLARLRGDVTGQIHSARAANDMSLQQPLYSARA